MLDRHCNLIGLQNFARCSTLLYSIHQTTASCKQRVHREQFTLDHFSLQVHAETDPTVESGPASNGGTTTVEGGTASNGGATALKKDDEEGNGSEMEASAHQSGRMSGKKRLDL